MNLVLFDIPEVIDRLKSELRGNLNPISFSAGVFPAQIPEEVQSQKYDLILLYSVIHYTEKSFEMIEAAVKLLAPGGKLLVGDIPNLSKKGRFLSSAFGRAFEASYKKTSLDQIPEYKDHKDFEEKNAKLSTAHLNDEFILKTLSHFRNSGFNAYVLDQPSTLPFSYTREDILIGRPHA